MNIIIPLTIISVSLIGVLYIVWKKTPYLKKLSVSEEGSYGFWKGMFPGIAVYVEKVDIGAHRQEWMKEFEKFIRRLRVVSLKLDNFTNSLLHKIRTKNGELKNSENKLEFKNIEKTEEKEMSSEDSLDDLKKEEQKLIIEIAKDPKNKDLYKGLGGVYLEMDNMKDAVESFKVALELDPEDREIESKLEKIKKHLGT